MQRARDGGKPAGQRRVWVAKRFQPGIYFVWIPGFLCGNAGSGRVSRQVDGGSLDEPGVSLIFSPSLNDLPKKRAKSELFAGFSHHV